MTPWVWRAMTYLLDQSVGEMFISSHSQAWNQKRRSIVQGDCCYSSENRQNPGCKQHHIKRSTVFRFTCKTEPKHDLYTHIQRFWKQSLLHFRRLAKIWDTYLGAFRDIPVQRFKLTLVLTRHCFQNCFLLCDLLTRAEFNTRFRNLLPFFIVPHPFKTLLRFESTDLVNPIFVHSVRNTKYTVFYYSYRDVKETKENKQPSENEQQKSDGYNYILMHT